MSGVAEVLNVHNDWAFDLERGEVLCVGCDWSQQVGLIDLAAEVFRTHQAAMLAAAGFGPVKGEKRLMQLAALMAYEAVEENVKREAAAAALEEAADEVTCGTQEIPGNDYANTGLSDAVLWHEVRSWLRATAAAVRGEG